VGHWDTERGCRAVRLRKELLPFRWLKVFTGVEYASVYVSEREAKEEKRELKKRRINEMVREGRAFVPELSGMFKYYCEPCTIVKE